MIKMQMIGRLDYTPKSPDIQELARVIRGGWSDTEATVRQQRPLVGVVRPLIYVTVG